MYAAAGLVCRHTYLERRATPSITRRTLVFPISATPERLRIAHLSDVHAGHPHVEENAEIVQQTNALGPI